MFSLIITIISIALVTALALATIYYGGSAFRQGADAAGAARLINEGQQLSGAAAVVESSLGTGSLTSTTQTALVDAKALSAKIASYAEASTGRSFVSAVAAVPTAVCDKVNEKAGLTVRPTDATGVTNYGCYGLTTAAGTMVFKF
jgi:hypothetical protein